MKKITHNAGFTLLELLVVLAIIIVVGTIVVGILFVSLRGSERSKSLNNLENNGNAVIAQMGKAIRFAKEFNGVSTDGSSYISDCSVAAPGDLTPTPSPSTYRYIKITAFDDLETVFSCGDGTSLSSNSASLIDNSTVTMIGCKFSCQQASSSDYPTIGINFSLNQLQPTGTILLESTASAIFQTSVVPRNTQR